MLSLNKTYTKMMEKVIKFLIPYCERYEIRDHTSNELYLVRYMLFKSRPFSIYIHRFMRSDVGDHHDHPWNFFTYVATKGYYEERVIQNYEPGNQWTRGEYQLHQGFRAPGSLAFRRATDAHKVLTDPKGETVFTDEEDAPLTVCFILKRQRVWGFIKNVYGDTKFGNRIIGHKWINFQDYLGFYPDDPNFKGGE